ncbi:GGDEF domain-containing protein [Gallionella capsiferriformans]|uniref:diguanylate cyclase n=1 Tax=Gallionella capsiferriformans (strain ES-2) TaxID=395494 RepID=D9SIX6_GALCS|nr:GGDEF domain-containing protein [Gallionella capsiferriformans]ADL54252.1 diguanylate cyclase [Gallionella capsiferriformans ES-2]
MLLPDLNSSLNHALQSLAAMTGQRDRELLARTLVATLSELMEQSVITLYRLVGDEAILVAQAGTAIPPDQIAEPSIIISDRLEFKSVIDSRCESITSLDAHTTSVTIPIYGQQEITALLVIITNANFDQSLSLPRDILTIYSNYLNLLDESETDTLTGLLNRRTFDNNLEKMLTECTDAEVQKIEINSHSRKPPSSELPHWLAVMDIDHFKRINDEFGHLYGDEVLLLLSRCMRRNFRQTDKLFRFGGEEFVVVLDRTCEVDASKVLERFRTAIECYDFPQVGRVTISIGFTCLNGKDDPSTLVGRADQALYYAKEHGRNQVCFYEGLIAEGNLTAEHFTDDVQLF